MKYPKGFSQEVAKIVLEKSGSRCWYCGIELSFDSRFLKTKKGSYAIDHFVPAKKGGSDEMNNLVPACWTCNTVKRDHTIESFREVMVRVSNGAPKFTNEQICFLRQNGIDLPLLIPYTFYFERAGLKR